LKRSPEEHDAARRFNILIDTLYEARTLAGRFGRSSTRKNLTADDGTFEFRRTVSRLIEMQNED
jgi:cell division protein ZapE